MNQTQIVVLAALVALGIAGVAAGVVELARERREQRRYPRGRPVSPDTLAHYQRDDEGNR